MRMKIGMFAGTAMDIRLAQGHELMMNHDIQSAVILLGIRRGE
jgi:hypothetical protein